MAVVVILGSYRKHFTEIQHAKSVFEQAGWSVPVPHGQATDERVQFVRLTGDVADADPADLEAGVIKEALEADVVYFVIPDGYIGRSVSYELGYLLGAGKQVYLSHLPDDLPAVVTADQIASPEQLVAKLS